MESVQDIIDILKDWSKDIAEGKLIKDQGYDDTGLVENRRITKYDLDKVSQKYPIIIRHISSHLYATNSLRLKYLGITEETQDPHDAVYCRDPKTGEHNGVIEEGLDKMNLVLEDISVEDEIKSIKMANDIYSSVGVTTASTSSTRTFREVELIKRGQEKKDIKTRVILNKTEMLIDDLKDYSGYDNMFLKGSGKTFQDGSIQGYTGSLSKAYYKHDDLEYKGYSIRSVDELVYIVEKFHINGEQIFIHCNGDQAIEEVIDTIEIVQKKYPRKDPRHVAIHSQMVREDQLDRMKELGILTSFFILHTYYWGDRHRDIFMGPKRAARMSH